MIKSKKLPANIEDLIPKALTYLQSRPEILFAYLFGSFGKGKHFPLSDVDIAVYLKEPLDVPEKKMETQDAVARNFEIIGEAVKNVSKALKAKYNNIQWKEIAGMRDKVIHFCFGVNWDIVWGAVKDSLPPFKEKIERILEVIDE